MVSYLLSELVHARSSTKTLDIHVERMKATNADMKRQRDDSEAQLQTLMLESQKREDALQKDNAELRSALRAEKLAAAAVSMRVTGETEKNDSVEISSTTAPPPPLSISSKTSIKRKADISSEGTAATKRSKK